MSCKILVAAHKPFHYVNYGDCYKVIQVGAAKSDVKLPYLHDDYEDNISSKNSTYCELTALYWGWKNVDADIKGLCHYRRYLAHHVFSLNQKKNILHEDEIRGLLRDNDILVAKPGPRTLELSWYPTERDLNHDRPYVYTKRAVAEVCPEYLPAVEQFYHGNKISPLNIVIARSDVYDAYCAWLFPVADRIAEMLEEENGIPDREIGFITERFLSIWLLFNQNKYKVRFFNITKTDNQPGPSLLLKTFAERIGLLSLIRFSRSSFEHSLFRIKSLMGKPVVNPNEWIE